MKVAFSIRMLEALGRYAFISFCDAYLLNHILLMDSLHEYSSTQMILLHLSCLTQMSGYYKKKFEWQQMFFLSLD